MRLREDVSLVILIDRFVDVYITSRSFEHRDTDVLNVSKGTVKSR